jgi:hypothetical protein
MNRFRKLVFVDYDGGSGLQVHSSLLNIVLPDWASATARRRTPEHMFPCATICGSVLGPG